MKQGDQLAIYCRACKKATIQEVLSVFDHDYSSDDEWDRYGVVSTAFLRCACNKAQIRIENHETSSDRLWPPEHIPSHPKRELPDWVNELPPHIADLLKEVHFAWAHGQRWLVAMGVRSLIDMFAVERVGDLGGFEKKLVQLQKEGYLGATDKVVIGTAVEVGHGATHRAQAPNDTECQQVLEIVENLLQRLVLADHAADLSARQGKRKLKK